MPLFVFDAVRGQGGFMTQSGSTLVQYLPATGETRPVSEIRVGDKRPMPPVRRSELPKRVPKRSRFAVKYTPSSDFLHEKSNTFVVLETSSTDTATSESPPPQPPLRVCNACGCACSVPGPLMSPTSTSTETQSPPASPSS